MQNTVNLNLKKPDQNDFVNIGDINDNMDILDAEVAKKYVKPLAGIPSLDLDSATQAALKKAETALQSVTKASVGLGNVDNTSDVNKPVSTAQQVALDKKANLASPILTGTPTAPTAAESTNTQQIATTAFVDRAVKTHQADLAYQTAGGTANAITLTTATLTNGYAKTFIVSANNNGTATTINGKQLYKPNTTTAPTLIAGKAYTVWYNQSSDCFFIKASADGNATTSQVLAGATFSNDIDTGLTGEIPSKSAQTYTPTRTNQTIASGQYLSGTQTIKGDANLKPENIKSGINIFGVTGNSGDFPFSSIDNNALTLKGLNFTSDKTYYYRVIDDAITKYSYWDNAILSKKKSPTVGVDGTYYYQLNNNQDLKVFSLDTDSLIYTIQNPNTNINGYWIGAYIRIYRSGQTLFLHSPYNNVAYFITLQGNLLRTINYGLDEGSKRTIGGANAYWVSSTKLLIFNSSGGSMSSIDAYIVDFSNLTSQRIGFLPGITLDYNFNFEIPVMLAFKAAM